jgi:hypothetical protein
LIQYWHHRLSKSKKNVGRLAILEAVDWARDVTEKYGTQAIVTPVFIEFVAGTRGEHELKVARAFLGEFRIADEGAILYEDWITARRFAERIPRDAKPRQLGDCLIRAIAKRLRRDVISLDRGFPSR